MFSKFQKRISWPIIALLIVSLSTIYGQENNITRDDIIGRWIGSSIYEFKADSTYTIIDGHAGDSVKGKGSFKIIDSKIVTNRPEAVFGQDLNHGGSLKFDQKMSKTIIMNGVKANAFSNLLVKETKWDFYDTLYKNKQTASSTKNDIDYTIKMINNNYTLYKLDSQLRKNQNIVVDNILIHRIDIKTIEYSNKISSYRLPISLDAFKKIEYASGIELILHYKSVQRFPVPDGLDYWYLGVGGFEDYSWIYLPAQLSQTFKNYPLEMQVKENYVNYRNKPILTGRKLGQLNKNDKIVILKNSRNPENIKSFGYHYWYQFTKDSGETGWVFGAFVECSKK